MTKLTDSSYLIGDVFSRPEQKAVSNWRSTSSNWGDMLHWVSRLAKWESTNEVENRSRKGSYGRAFEVEVKDRHLSRWPSHLWQSHMLISLRQTHNCLFRSPIGHGLLLYKYPYQYSYSSVSVNETRDNDRAISRDAHSFSTEEVPYALDTVFPWCILLSNSSALNLAYIYINLHLLWNLFKLRPISI